MSKIKVHNLLFFLGFIYYLIIPPLIGINGLFHKMPGMENWYIDFYSARKNLYYYFFIVMSYAISFYIGSFFINLLPKKKRKVNRINKKQIDLGFIAILFLILTIYIIFTRRSIIFTGYKTYGDSILGILATVNSTCVVFLFYIIFNGKKTLTEYSIFMFIILLSSLILVGLGSRMYVLIPIICFLIYKTYYAKKKLRVKKILLYSITALMVFLIIGAWRIGVNLSLDFMIYLFIAEPTFTWWSSASFLANNNLDIITFPSNYLSSFFNFLPSFLFNNKALLINSIQDRYFYESPLGADSIFVNIQGNFGWFLGFFFMFGVGLYYSIIEKMSRRNSFFLAYYIGVLAILPFQFFRDNFAIVNKQLFWNMLIMPIILMSLISISIEFLKAISFKK